jgi:hypothetical protein
MTTVPANSIASITTAQATPHNQPATPNSSFSNIRQMTEKPEVNSSYLRFFVNVSYSTCLLSIV